MAEQWKANHCSLERPVEKESRKKWLLEVLREPWGWGWCLKADTTLWVTLSSLRTLGDLCGFLFFSQELGIDLHIVQRKLQSLATRQDKDIVSKEAGPIDLPWMREDKIMTPLSYEGSLCKVTQGKLLARGVCLDTSLWKWSWEAVCRCFR